MLRFLNSPADAALYGMRTTRKYKFHDCFRIYSRHSPVSVIGVEDVPILKLDQRFDRVLLFEGDEATSP
jgi:hypothetical protein